MNRQKLFGLVLTILVALALLALRSLDPPIVTELRAAGFDTLQRIWPRPIEQPQAVTVVDIDEASLHKLGQWPWLRCGAIRRRSGQLLRECRGGDWRAP